jgi:NAD+ synthase (glutamine-hydrolysing)
MRIALAQLNLLVGDLDGNAALILEAAQRAKDAEADIVLFPEQAIGGYPAEDLWLRRDMLTACRETLEQLVPQLPLPALVGFPELDEEDGLVYNSCAVIGNGEIVAIARKVELPNYGVFDEQRWFTSGSVLTSFDIGDVCVGVTICEDLWVDEGPADALAVHDVQVIVNASASPWRIGRGRDREDLLVRRAREAKAFVVLCNLVGGQDELVFDGQSIVVAPDGSIAARGMQFEPDLLIVDIDVKAGTAQGSRAPTLDELAETWSGLRLGLRDYVDKNGFAGVIVPVSGGIDSAVVLALAVDALGASRVRAVTMPSPITSDETLADARLLAANLGVELDEIPIAPVVDAFVAALEPVLGEVGGVTLQNLQARIRGTLVMARSNAGGGLVLAAGNKSETSVGYMTLYGDMAGGFAPIRDLPKLLVWDLARWFNDQFDAPIPESIIEREPTAELAPGQRDTDSLPPYAELDPLLDILVGQLGSVDEAIAAGFDEQLVRDVLRRIDAAEYKRRQAPPGIRATARAFGRDWRMPITRGRSTS